MPQRNLARSQAVDGPDSNRICRRNRSASESRLSFPDVCHRNKYWTCPSRFTPTKNVEGAKTSEAVGREPENIGRRFWRLLPNSNRVAKDRSTGPITGFFRSEKRLSAEKSDGLDCGNETVALDSGRGLGEIVEKLGRYRGTRSGTRSFRNFGVLRVDGSCSSAQSRMRRSSEFLGLRTETWAAAGSKELVVG